MKERTASSMSVVEGKPVHVAALDSPLFNTYPNIMKHLAVTRYDSGKPRLPGTVIMRCESTSWKIIAKEPTAALQLVLVAQTFDDALALLELILGAEEAPWEDDPNAWKPKGGGRKSG